MTLQSVRILFCSVLFAATLLSGCKKKEDVPTSEVAVSAEKAEVKPLTEYITAEAVLTPKAQAAIVPKLSAPVKTFLVQRGARVHKGQLLATLQNADLAAAVVDSRGALKQADATYSTTTKAGVVEDLLKAKSDVAQAKASLDVAQTVFDSRNALLKQGAIPRRDVDTAQATLVQAKGAYDTANQHLTSLNSVSQTATIANAQGLRESAQGKYQAAEAGLNFSEIRSPIDGVVTDRSLFAGEMPAAGAPILTVMDLSTLIAKVHLSQEQTAKLKVGTQAILTIPGEDAPVKAKVSLISPALDTGSTTIEVWVAVPNKDASLKAGSAVHVSIASETVRDALTIPNEALIVTKGGDPAVMVIGPDNIAHQKPVKTGISDGKDTQILSGLVAGDMVVTTGAYGMDDATKVRIKQAGAVDDDEKPAAAKAQDGGDK